MDFTKFTPGLISVIIPLYKQGRFIPVAFDSLIAQSYSNWEAIVVDDGSPDEGADITREYSQRDARIKLIQQSNAGTSAAKNTGLLHSKGEFIQFLDADDLLFADKFKNAIDIFNQKAEVDFVYTNVRYFDDGDQTNLRYGLDKGSAKWVKEFNGNSFEILPQLTEGNLFTIHMPIFRRKLLARSGIFLDILRGAEDWDLWFRIIALGIEIHYDANPQSLALVRVHPTSASRDTDAMRRFSLLVRKRINRTLIKLGLPKLLRKNQQLIYHDRKLLLRSYLKSNRILSAAVQMVFLIPYALHESVNRLVNIIRK